MSKDAGQEDMVSPTHAEKRQRSCCPTLEAAAAGQSHAGINETGLGAAEQRLISKAVIADHQAAASPSLGDMSRAERRKLLFP